ncbi:rubredoxin [Chitinophaga varians]|uniref:rubredoxin n=1 Tax=Chitinophaga varians TaxID=2202339 RepID=UPI00165F282C|nr:rubredoxin [Chitinophaga varians]MBC9913000.1 rubredoxin [Chitinophaga varians]
MARQTHTISVNFRGGIIPPGVLLDLLEVAAEATVTHIRFGLRQQLLLNVPDKQLSAFQAACNDRQIDFSAHPNILSTYPAAGIFLHDTWLVEGIYKDVFNQFDYLPALKVNICDSKQTFVPLFTGHINWISSNTTHYWHLYLRLPGSQELFRWPELIYTNSIATVSKATETLMLRGLEPAAVFSDIKALLPYVFQESGVEPEFPAFHLPYYEGFNKQDNSYWLGIYRRDETFPVPFLKEVCRLCLETRTGQLYNTPWKSLVIKNIDPAHRYLWDYLLGKYGINVRHAANELNWQVEDNSEDGLILKRYIIRHFDVADVRTYGLCFSIRMQEQTSLFGNIIIRRKASRHGSKLKYMQRYDILYTDGFNANSSALIPYREDVSKEQLGPYVASLCKLFYEQKSETDMLQHFVKAQQSPVVRAEAMRKVHQCVCCLTVYDETVGDEWQEVPAGTPFASLPPAYCCSVCEAEKDTFREITVPVSPGQPA